MNYFFSWNTIIKTKLTILISGFVIVMLLCLSCDDTPLNSTGEPGTKIYFEVEYINYAWGYAYRGWMIDSDGGVWSYNPARDRISYLYHPDGYYSEQELQSKYEHAKGFIRNIAYDNLLWNQTLATLVSANDRSDTTQDGYDMGMMYYSVYKYRPFNSQFQKIILQAEGDMVFHSTSMPAVALVKWMKSL